MTPLELLVELRSRGVFLAAAGDRLAFDAPAGTMTSNLRACLKQRRAELLAVLRIDGVFAAVSSLGASADPVVRSDLTYRFEERWAVCEWCGGLAPAEAVRLATAELRGEPTDK